MRRRAARIGLEGDAHVVAEGAGALGVVRTHRGHRLAARRRLLDEALQVEPLTRGALHDAAE